MNIPDCYEAYLQEEQRQREMDIYMEKLPTCCICGKKICENEIYHEAYGKYVCTGCIDELEVHVGYVEVD